MVSPLARLSAPNPLKGASPKPLKGLNVYDFGSLPLGGFRGREGFSGGMSPPARVRDRKFIVSLHPSNNNGMEKKEPTYKEAYDRLREIQRLIETNQLDIDHLTGVLSEAAGLLKICKGKLYTIDEEVQRILKEME